MNNLITHYCYRCLVALMLGVATILTSSAQTLVKKKTVLKAESVATPALTVNGKPVVGGAGSIVTDTVFENYSFKTTKNVFLGNKSGTGISQIWTPYNNPTGKRSVFSLNNQANLSKPLLFGYFADNANPDDPASAPSTMSQLGINTTTMMDNAALTVRGGLAIVNPDWAPASMQKLKLGSDAYCKFLLWVERGIVSENYAVAPVCTWDGDASDCSGTWGNCTSNPWGDFVFEKDYQLRPLSEVEEYVKKEKHLPEIPSANEIATKGYLMHEMNKNFIIKIEELTLYSIEQEKTLLSQQQRIDNLEKQLKSYELLAKELAEIKASLDSAK